MGIAYKLQVFEGPLDLLLHLIEKNKVDIYDIPIVAITVSMIREPTSRADPTFAITIISPCRRAPAAPMCLSFRKTTVSAAYRR